MSLITAKELTAGVARGQVLRGRVCMLNASARNSVDTVELHLVVEKGLSGMLYIQAWRDQARWFMQVAKEGHVLEITHLTIKAMGDKRQWQCTDLDVYGQNMAGTQ